MASRCYWIRIHFHEYVYNANEKTLLPRSNRCQGHYLPIAKTLQGEDPSQVDDLVYAAQVVERIGKFCPIARAVQAIGCAFAWQGPYPRPSTVACPMLCTRREETHWNERSLAWREGKRIRQSKLRSCCAIKRFHSTCSLCISVQDGIFLGKEPLDCGDFGV
jgi:hypothetical protein